MRQTGAVLLALCTVALVVALCGCGGSGGTAGPGEDAVGKPQPPPPPPPVPPGKLVGSKVVSAVQNVWGIFTMNTNGTDKVQVNVGGGSAAAHCWSQPDAALILLGGLSTVPRAGGTPTVFVAQEEPGLPMGVGSVSNGCGAWSPDGSRVAFKRYWVDDEYYNLHAIAVKDWPNGPARLITPGQQMVRDEFPTWSPDGEYVLFQRYDHSLARGQLMVVAADGQSPPYYVAENDLSVKGPSDWYRDDTTGENCIVYGSGGLARLQVDATGHAIGSPIALPDGGYSSYYRCPRWSPDGRFVAFSNENVTKKGSVFTTYILDVTGESPGSLYTVGDLGFVDWAAQ